MFSKMASDIPQWYFWTLLALSLATVPVLIYNYIMHHRERKKDHDSDKRAEFKSRGNISGKRQTFTLVRDPFKRTDELQTVERGETHFPLGMKGLVGDICEREKTMQLAYQGTQEGQGTSKSTEEETGKWQAEHLLKVKMYEPS